MKEIKAGVNIFVFNVHICKSTYTVVYFLLLITFSTQKLNRINWEEVIDQDSVDNQGKLSQDQRNHVTKTTFTLEPVPFTIEDNEMQWKARCVSCTEL